MPEDGNHFQSSSTLPLTRDSEEWGSVEMLLKVTFRSANISLRSLWSVSNPGLLARFEKRITNMTGVIPTLIASEDIGPALTIGTVCDKGFPDTDNGLRVQIGNLCLPSGFLNAGLDGTRVQGRGRRMFEFLVVKVAVGKSIVLDEPEEEKKSLIEDLPNDYDSVLIRPPSPEPETTPLRVTSSNPSKLTKGFLPPHCFCQTYILRDGTQILPMFVCRFEVDTDKDEPLSLEPCQNCEENPATIWCAADSAALCPQCDESHHAVNRLTQRHIRVPINERPRESGPCSFRPDQIAELWNDSMGIAVCRETQKEQYPSTEFEELRVAYKSSVKLARRPDDVFEAAKENLLARIKAQDEAISSLERMFDECEDMAYRKIADGLQKALQLTERKTNNLITGEKSLQVRIQFLQWAEELLAPYAHMLAPSEWLHIWLVHYRLVRKYALDTDDQVHQDTKISQEETAEMKIEGSLFVKESGIIQSAV
jgi:hypothetical protein